MKIILKKGATVELKHHPVGAISGVMIVTDRSIEFDIDQLTDSNMMYWDGVLRTYYYEFPYPKYKGREILSITWTRNSTNETVIT